LRQVPRSFTEPTRTENTELAAWASGRALPRPPTPTEETVIPLISFDHIMAGVRQFGRLESDFADAGFAVIERHDEGTRPIPERLVCFADGSCIEIQEISADNPNAPANRYWTITRDRTGFTDYALSVNEVEWHRDSFAANGHPAGSVNEVSRRTRAGAPWGIKVAALGRSVGSPVLPMLIEHTTDISIRVPPPPGGVHPNGATRVAGVVLVAADPASATKVLDDLLGAHSESGPEKGFESPQWFFGDRWVTLAAASYPGAAEYLATVGDGVLEVSLASLTAARPRRGEGELFDPDRLHGLRLRQVTG
jgi:hypothetical protein